MYVTQTTLGSSEQILNVGYVTHLLLIDAAQVLEILDPERYPNPNNLVPYNGIVVKPNTAVVRMVFGEKSCGMQEVAAENNDGIQYTVNIEAVVPKGGALLNNWLASAVAKRWLLLLRDSNDSCYLVGAKDAGARLSHTHVLGVADTTRLSLTAKAWHSCWRLEGIELALLWPDAEFDYSFDLSFTA